MMKNGNEQTRTPKEEVVATRTVIISDEAASLAAMAGFVSASDVDTPRMKEAASKHPLDGILEYTEEPIVSSDVIRNSHSAVFDGSATRVLHGDYVKVLAWYDNEWGYSSRVVDLIKLLMSFER